MPDRDPKPLFPPNRNSLRWRLRAKWRAVKATERGRDVRFYGGFPLALALVPAGIYGIWLEVTVYEELICFHSVWGTGAIILAIALVVSRYRKSSEFNEILEEPGKHSFVQNEKRLKELLRDLPSNYRTRFEQHKKDVSHLRE